MIAKHVPMKNRAKSDFAGLVEYITDSQSKEHRLGSVQATNCESATVEAAIEEILATQHMNKRATGDKTYHLILSFRAGESPDHKVMTEIEERVCASLGFADHQRVSAVHNDTDNLHIHIAINKIHPKKHTIHEPYQDFKTLAQICEKLEIEYGLEPDNHVAARSISENKALDMERHSGIESLVSWIKNECLSDMQAAQSWERLHEVLHSNGLSITPRGNGLVITDLDSGVTVKPSTVNRELSKGALESRLGEYEKSEFLPEKTKPIKSYKKKPVALSGVNTVELYAQYRKEQEQYRSNQSAALAALIRGKNKKISDAKASNKLRRRAIKLMGGSPIAKRILYAQASRALKSQIVKINADYRHDRGRFYEQNKRETWADWLKSSGEKGNLEAVEALRARGKREQKNSVRGEGKRPDRKITHKEIDGLTKKGTYVLRGKGAIKDDGKQLKLGEKSDRETFKEALILAAEKYGNQITVTGSPLFKAQAVRAAVDSNLKIIFADPVLEAKRQKLLLEKKDDRANNRIGSRRSAGDDDGRGSRATYGSKRGESHYGDGRDERDGRAAGGGKILSKSGVARIGAKPPPQSQNRLRGLSQLSVVRIAGGSEMLLPRDVSHNVEQQRAKSDTELRRPILGGGGVNKTKYTENQVAAVEKYVSERESKRAKGFDISQHLRYNGDAKSSLEFAGLRKIDNENLALLKDGDSVLVMPINSATASRLRRIKVGQSVSINDQGAIQTGSGRGKSR